MTDKNETTGRAFFNSFAKLKVSVSISRPTPKPAIAPSAKNATNIFRKASGARLNARFQTNVLRLNRIFKAARSA